MITSLSVVDWNMGADVLGVAELVSIDEVSVVGDGHGAARVAYDEGLDVV